MKNLKMFIAMALFIVSGLLSCSDKDNPLTGTSIFTINNFPHEIGTVWQYQRRVDDSRSFRIDTLFVRIADSAIITDDSLMVYVVIADLVTSFEKSSDTTYWHISGDSVTYYKYVSDSLYRIIRNVVFPLEIGSVWSSGVFPPDSNEVMQISPQTILGKNYNSAYQIIRTASGFNEYYLDSFLYVPNIGLLQSNESHILWTTTKDETWKLISFYQPDSFELSDFPLQVNASWDYKVINNLVECVNCYDSVNVTITDSSFNGIVGSINQNWLFDYPNQEKFVLNSLTGNTLYMQWHQYTVFFSLEFPFTVGQSWLYPSPIGNVSSVRVLGRETVSTEAGTFKNAYYIKGYTNDGFEPGSNFEMWIAKGVGIIKLKHNGPVMGNFEDKSWELQSYAPNKPAASFTIDKFPNYDGMTRTYEVFDNIRQVFDTVYVQVAESSLVAIWNYTNSDSSWQELISIEGTVVKFISSGRVTISHKSFEFPITIGDSWVTYPFGNISTVLFATALTLPAGRFFPCYGIETIFNCGDGCVRHETDFVYPSIGIVQRNIFNNLLGINETWRLIGYTNP